MLKIKHLKITNECEFTILGVEEQFQPVIEWVNVNIPSVRPEITKLAFGDKSYVNIIFENKGQAMMFKLAWANFIF